MLPDHYSELPRWSFGDSPQQADQLLALVLSGTKTATCSALQGYVNDQEPLPQQGSRAIIEDGQGVPACVIELISVTQRRFHDIDAAFARAEGEGDLSLMYWQREHQAFFERLGLFAKDMLLVCEHFRVIEVLSRER
ncbi:ASCH domain-containing protein [Carnimonas bestiolae]|uniref:ASCH domain-containing protein n=1 Tax=Carnimonas bestiolae TaxID=3402172 RepID=UPI003EDBA62D